MEIASFCCVLLAFHSRWLFRSVLFPFNRRLSVKERQLLREENQWRTINMTFMGEKKRTYITFYGGNL
jgi:hypothetical protein